MDKKKTILSLLITGTIGLYFIYQQAGKTQDIVATSNVTPKVIISSGTVNTALITGISKANIATKNDVNTIIEKNTKTTTPNTKMMNSSRNMGMMNMSKYKDGTYKGRTEDAYYGYIQVAVVIRRGKIIDVKFLNYPQDRGNSRRVNHYAMPYLRAEAIQAQSAKVDTVSGATFSSGAFRKSLASALIKATA